MSPRRRETENERIDTDLAQAGQRRGPHRDEQPQPPEGDREAGKATYGTEHHALREQLPDDMPALGAQRGAYRHLSLPSFRTNDEQVGDVGARDEQHDRHGPQEDPENVPDIPDHILLERPHERTEPRLGEHAQVERAGEQLDRHWNHAFQIGVCLRHCGARGESPECLVAEVPEEDL